MSNVMKNWVETILVVIVTISIIVTRFNISNGLIANIFLLLLCGVLLCFRFKHILPLSKEIKGYLKALFVYYLCVIPSILFSYDPVDSSLFKFALTLVQNGAFFIIVFFIRKRKYLVLLLSCFFLFSGIDCLLTLIQLIFGGARANRGYGFGGRLLSIADIMCMLLPMALVILMDTKFEKELKKPAAFAIIGVLIGLICNKSRGAWLTELIVVPISVFSYLKQNRKHLIYFAVVTLCMIGFMFTNPQYVQRIHSITNTTTDHSNADRIWTWKSAKYMIQDYPIAGVGFGMFHEVYEKSYKYEQETQNLAHTHNNFIQVAVECGIIGLAGFLYFVWYFLHTSLRNYLKNPNPYDLLIFTIFLSHICIFGQIEYTLWIGAGVQSIFMFLIAILFCLKET